MQRWLCTNIRRSRMRRQQRNPDRFEWTTIIKRFEDRAYGRLDSSLLFNYSFVHLPAPLTASRYMLQVRNAVRWMVIKDNEQEKQKEQEELIGIEVEEWKKGPRKAKEETTGVNTWWMMMIDSRVMNYDDPDILMQGSLWTKSLICVPLVGCFAMRRWSGSRNVFIWCFRAHVHQH